MRRTFVILCFAGLFGLVFVLAGCETTRNIDTYREDILRALDGGELAVGVALAFAQTRGADTTQAELDVALAFDTARDVVRVDFGDLSPANLQTALDDIKLVTADVVKICQRAGVSQARIELLETSAESTFAVLEKFIASLEKDKAAFFRPSALPSTCTIDAYGARA